METDIKDVLSGLGLRPEVLIAEFVIQRDAGQTSDSRTWLRDMHLPAELAVLLDAA